MYFPKWLFCITARTSDLVQSKPVNRGTEGPWKVSVITALRKRGLAVGESLKMFFFFLRFNWGNGFDDHKCIRRYHLLKKQKLKYRFLPLYYVFLFLVFFFFSKIARYIKHLVNNLKLRTKSILKTIPLYWWAASSHLFNYQKQTKCSWEQFSCSTRFVHQLFKKFPPKNRIQLRNTFSLNIENKAALSLQF